MLHYINIILYYILLLNLDPAGSNLWEEKQNGPFGSECVLMVYYVKKKQEKARQRHETTITSMKHNNV